ncbi:exodeoxyribonuclease I [Caldichromatium japonicum]|uniref:Exodeoxyribonuclease I n=1 Tax=Caldichromatium japonicum TaxID=2699430 RepID=A0A6G7VCQ3_9GAMM|nr:exodeoxyribonuclease I [Caldichromatium japonicum]QIK37665.1 exodeoxyribonuclease I [Caldichromatium japonicum]
MGETFYWLDYETWGGDPLRDRPFQFAGLRTDAEFNPLGEPLVLFCQPSADLLPDPDACLITGLTPLHIAERGMREVEFARAIHAELSQAVTCIAGYNNLRFDDEITRHLFYRNFIDPYAHEWRDGNKRFDLIDVLRLARALRPEGLNWPLHPDGTPSFRLDELTAANDISHENAHDALADVKATIALARRLRAAQPRLFAYALGLRDKRRVRALLDQRRPLLHASARFPAELGCIAPILPLAPHPAKASAVICFDLRAEPLQLLDLTVDELQRRLFTPTDRRPQGVIRVPLKVVHINRVPMLAPMNTLTPVAAERWRIDPQQVIRHACWIAERGEEIAERVQALFQPLPATDLDPELALYSGGFIPDADRRLCAWVQRAHPEDLRSPPGRFTDPRLSVLLLRYRARNWPETLSETERAQWEAIRRRRLIEPEGGGSIQLDCYRARLSELAQQYAADPVKCALIGALRAWGDALLPEGTTADAEKSDCGADTRLRSVDALACLGLADGRVIP